MGLIIFLKGIFIGFALAVPIGPIGIMCIRKTLNEGRLRGLIVGLGAATADLLYGCIAAFGITFIANTLVSQRIWIRLVGGALLLY
ncbi:MAG: LysE family transporter, partial [Ignavibacteriaceae bacterium]